MTKEPGKIIAITGIDTDIGKTIATGLIGRGLLEAGRSVITHKAVQTGCDDVSEDIVAHRNIMGLPRQQVDLDGKTCSYLFPVPCSPHLAARLAKRSIDPKKITRDARELSMHYQFVLLEGAGGLFVPLTEEVTLIDYFSEEKVPVILVSSSRLGSLNHTLASLEALHNRSMSLSGVVYNRHDDSDLRIAEDSLDMISSNLRKYGFNCPLIEMYGVENYEAPGACLPFSTLCLAG
ncbi:dethiobiotin synthase [Desulfosediminicola sp.]|uniref:dethiobiotin synthase n=1 Tax=Desulfosediminicola sp. TaxID=2886825 RepID=UPI003AF30C39